MAEKSKSIFAIYQPEDININEAILKSTQFKSKSSISEHEYSKDEFKKKLGEEHPFDYSVVEGVEKKFGLVSAIEDKICDYTLGPGIFIESKDNIEIEDYLNEWINKTNLQIYLTPWFRNGLGKGSSYLEVAGLSDIEKSEKIKVIDSNTVYVKRDDYGNIIEYNQYLNSIIKSINKDDILSLNKDNIVQLNINTIGNSAYGMGIVYSGMTIINDFLNAQSSSHKIMRRKANSPIHAKLGNVEKEDYPSQADIDSFGKKMQFMNETTEWVTGPNVEMNVLDFGNVGDKFKEMLATDLKLLSYAFQVPESIMGADKGYAGSSKIQDEGFNKNIRSYQQQIGFVLKSKLFDTLILQKGLKGEYKVVWGKQTEDDKNNLRDSYQKLLATSSGLSEGMRKEYEKKLATLDDIEYELVEKENAKILRRNNREQKKSFNNQLQLQKTNPQAQQNEHEIQQFIKKEMILGKAPQEIESDLSKEFNVNEDNAFIKVTEEIDEFTKDYPLEEWVGEYLHVKKEILEGIKGDQFEMLAAKTRKDLSLGLLNKNQVEQLRTTFDDAFVNSRGLHEIADNIKKLDLKDRYVLKDGKKVLAISKDKRPYMIARTETVRLRAQGSLIGFENKKVNNVVFENTSSRPCPECESLDGNIYPINEAMGIIPVHSGCRCKWSEA